MVLQLGVRILPEHFASTQTVPATARSVAIDLIGAVLRRKRPLDDAIDDNREMGGLPARDRAFARLLVATVLRRLGQIDALIAHCLNTPLPPRAAMVHDMLRLGIAQLLFLRTPPHAAVATTVDLADHRGFLSHKGLVNAVLRRLSQQGPDLVAAQDAPRLNTPDWLWRSWSEAYGEAGARGVALAHLKEAPLDITVRADLEKWRDALEATVLPTGTLRRTGGGAIMNLPGYAEGAWWVQDAAAAIPATLLGKIAGQRVVDLCAAPGGKTAQLAAAGAHVIAIDRSPRRLRASQPQLGAAVVRGGEPRRRRRHVAPPEPVALRAARRALHRDRRHPPAPRRAASEIARRRGPVWPRSRSDSSPLLSRCWRPAARSSIAPARSSRRKACVRSSALLARGAPVEARSPSTPRRSAALPNA